MRRIAIIAALALTLWPARARAVEPGLVPGDWCQERDEVRIPWTPEERERTRERVESALVALGVAEHVRAYHQVILCREAFCGEASVRHTLGEDVAGKEDGLGPHGLSLRWHRDKWPGDDEDPAWCTPEASAVTAHELIRRAVVRFGARNLVEIQAVYAGAVECRDGECRFTLAAQRRRRLCERLRGHGVDCAAPVTRADLGRSLALEHGSVRYSAADYLPAWQAASSALTSAS